MTRHFSTTFGAIIAMTALACGGGDSANQTADAGAANPCAADAGSADAGAANPCAGMDMPEWFKMDEAAKTVTLDIAAGSTDANNHWNFNGYFGGNATITVPEGYTVTINFTNNDPLTTHSIGVDATTSDFPTVFDAPSPVFDGAISPNPTSMTDATVSGQSVTMTFMADASGEYALVCYIPGHAVTGMYVNFTVSSDGSAGVMTM